MSPENCRPYKAAYALYERQWQDTENHMIPRRQETKFFGWVADHVIWRWQDTTIVKGISISQFEKTGFLTVGIIFFIWPYHVNKSIKLWNDKASKSVILFWKYVGLLFTSVVVLSDSWRFCLHVLKLCCRVWMAFHILVLWPGFGISSFTSASDIKWIDSMSSHPSRAKSSAYKLVLIIKPSMLAYSQGF